MTITTIRALIAGRPLYTIAANETVAAACALLDRHNIGALAVVTEGALVGVLSERDVIRKCYAAGCDIAQTRVDAIMTSNVEVAFVDDSLAEAMTTMMHGGFRHLPVVDDEGTAIAMLSMRDIPTENRLMVERYHDYLAPQPKVA